MQRKKINRAKVLAALNTVCPSRGRSISPAQIMRIDSERMRCPKCGNVFDATTATHALAGLADYKLGTRINE